LNEYIQGSLQKLAMPAENPPPKGVFAATAAAWLVGRVEHPVAATHDESQQGKSR
jgi:hypothetical protein